jgi:hypothetical protein
MLPIFYVLKFKDIISRVCMEHILSLISEYAGDIDDLSSMITQRTCTVRESELKITGLERYIDNTRELHKEGYAEHELFY